MKILKVDPKIHAMFKAACAYKNVPMQEMAGILLAEYADRVINHGEKQTTEE